jgi:hypothetical protein
MQLAMRQVWQEESPCLQNLSFDGKAMERFARRRRVRYNNGFGTIVILTATSRRDGRCTVIITIT